MSIIDQLKAEAAKLLGEAEALEHQVVETVAAEPAKVEQAVEAEVVAPVEHEAAKAEAEVAHVESEAKAEVAETVVEAVAKVADAPKHLVHVAGLVQEYVDENALIQEWKPKS